METLIIEPGQGIGLIRLGMNKEQVEKAIQEYESRYHNSNFVDNYFVGAFHVEYNLSGKANFIEIPWTLKNVFTCTCTHIDVFI
ncbi:hypothetical protein ACFVS2_05365 [Brevibacillus sp. NPDC058079]|uniref:hypothetical protein n=1 Tax=Brevibacillus sp. NPDC058079 TaxID=3346330 RepID=UPI0036F006E7